MSKDIKVSGFTFVRNALKFDYPVIESINSILPLCDEVIVLVGNSEDETRGLIESIASNKIKIFDSVWDDSLREGGRVLAAETDKALQKVSHDSDWAFYMQADEVIHEKHHKALKEAMLKYKDDKRVEGLLLKYVHFYGSYDFIGDSRKWYRNEIRVVRNNAGVRSFRDAQGFRIDNRLMKVKPIDAEVYHYGWVKPPSKQQEKQKQFHKLWHNDDWVEKNVAKADEFDYTGIDSLKRFTGTHPSVMQKRIAEKNWHFDFDPSRKRFSTKGKLLHGIEKVTGWRVGEYRNYKVV